MIAKLAPKNPQPIVRPITKADARILASINQAVGSVMTSPDAWVTYLHDFQRNGGAALGVSIGRQLVGYAMTRQVPGLPDQRALSMLVLPEYRRRGIGSYLLRAFINQLATSSQPVSRLIARFDRQEANLASFFEGNGFSFQHRELHMILASLEQIAAPKLPANMRLRTFHAGQDEATFVHYHTLAFADTPRYQPFTSQDVIHDQNEHFEPGDIMLLETHAAAPVGFVWAVIHKTPDTIVVQIEPMGVVPEYRGHGMGKLLLQMGLHYGRKRGATAAELWTSEDNTVSVNLYEKAGFKIAGGVDFYYIDIKSANQQ